MTEFEPPQTPTPGPPPGALSVPPPPTDAPPTADAPPQPYGYPPGGPPAAGRTSPKAIAALVLGIAGWLIFPFILSVLAIVFGAIARREIERDPALGGKGMAVWGFWLGITGLAAWVLFIVILVAAGSSS